MQGIRIAVDAAGGDLGGRNVIALEHVVQRQETAKQVARREEIGQKINLGLVLITFAR